MLRKPSISRFDHAGAGDEALRAKLNSLEYENKNLQQERNMLMLQHDKELRDLQAKSDTDFKKYQTAESAANKATQRYEALQKEVCDMQDQAINEKATLEKQVRDLRDRNQTLQEESNEAQGRLSEVERQTSYQEHDFKAKRAALQGTIDNLREEIEQLTQSFDAAQSQLVQRNADNESLENQVLSLKSGAVDSDTLNVLQTQLSEQVSHIRTLERNNREQASELRKLRDTHKSVQVVEEQKRGLETELRVLKEVEKQLGEAQIQKEILLDEKRQWTSLLEREGGDSEFSSPEAVVKALVEANIQVASLMERIGGVEADAAEKDEVLKAIDAERTALKDELEKLRSSTPSPSSVDDKAFKRLERQKNLANKEIEYLRAQLTSLENEDTMENPNTDAQHNEQIAQLQSLLDQYKTEIAKLQDEISKAEAAANAATEPRGTKRGAASQESAADTSEQLAPLLRKTKNLQALWQESQRQSQSLAKQLQATKLQLKELREKPRVLELRDNPTTQAEAIKLATLHTLQEENRALLAQLRGEDMAGLRVVPVSTVDALKLEIAEMEKVVADKEKRMRRQREIWSDKAAEFRDVVSSVLGWRITFMPNGKAKVVSRFHKAKKGGEDGDGEGEEEENYIVFDGEKGTMKISGGVEGGFAREIKEQVDFWVKEKGEIPGFLAALTIQFLDEYGSG
jgi:mitotic spindle assembly checkpoint protein MAD1